MDDTKRPRSEKGQGLGKNHVAHARLPKGVEERPEPETHPEVGGAERGGGAAYVWICERNGV
jgi:hypothetical protein